MSKHRRVLVMWSPSQDRLVSFGYSSSLPHEELKNGDNAPNKTDLYKLNNFFHNRCKIIKNLWFDISSQVKSSGVLETITPHERKLQESMFEIITSEASYLKSLNVLMDVFLCSDEFGSDMSNKCVLTRNERHVIFSNIGAIRDASER